MVYKDENCTLRLTPSTGLLYVEHIGNDCDSGSGTSYGRPYVSSGQALTLSYDLLGLGLLRTRQEDDAARAAG